VYFDTYTCAIISDVCNSKILDDSSTLQGLVNCAYVNAGSGYIGRNVKQVVEIRGAA
jgi:hypothetical protein